MTVGPDRWIRWTTIGCVALLALIAGTVSYLHMHLLVELHGQPGWVAALTSLSVDGMIVAASTTLLADSRSGCKGGALPWALLGAGSVASLAANVVVAEPSLIGRVIAAWPSFALIASYEMLMRQVRRAAEAGKSRQRSRGVRSRPEGAHRLVGPVFGCLMPGEGRPGAAGKRSSWHDSGRWPTSPVTARSGCDRRALWLWRGGGLRRGHARGRRLRCGVRRPTGATAGSAMNGCRRRLR